MKGTSTIRQSKALSVLKRCLELPEMRGSSLDSPTTTALRVSIIRRKAFLYRLYSEWYSRFKDAARFLPDGPKVELGSGAGFLKDVLADVITSEVLLLQNIDVVFSGEAMPFADSALAAIYLLDVFHHIAHPDRFLREATRCLKGNGRIIMIEPYNTWWGRQVWTRLHHEPFEPEARWDLPGSGPLSNANGALPWIVFERDRSAFERDFPRLRLLEIKPLMPLAYILSGGVSLRALLPGFCYPLCRCAEKFLGPFEHRSGMFAEIHVMRV